MELASAALAGGIARFICHPLDTIKTVSFTGFAETHTRSGMRPPQTRAATHSVCGFLQQQLSSVYHSAHQIWRAEGIRGFYRGVGVTVIGSAPGVGVYLSVYHWCNASLRMHYTKMIGTPTNSTMTQEKQGAGLGIWGHWFSFVSGLVAEAVSCLVWVPIDVSKERLQSQPPSLVGRYSGSWNALQTIVRLEGWGGLYKGYWSTLGSFGPYSGVYFVFYEYFSSKLTLADNVWRPLLAGLGATAVASVCTNPLELMKTRLQVQRTVLAKRDGVGHGTGQHLFRYHYKGLWDGIHQVVRTEGYHALWKGTAARIGYQAPNAALTMTLFEFFLRRCKSTEA